MKKKLGFAAVIAAEGLGLEDVVEDVKATQDHVRGG